MTSAAQRPPLYFADLASLEAFLAGMATARCEAPGLSELDHGLQCAAELEAVAPADEALQIAGLLHDIAHGQAWIGVHAGVGEAAIGDLFGARVARLVGLHVAAKRYKVTTDPAYRARLSRVSVRTLALQGGEMTAAEIAAFEAEDCWRDALILREADEAAKVPRRSVPGLDAWLPVMRRLAV
jgi:predicted HD phosphohydrolase